MPPTPAGSDAWTPVDRSSTTVVVAHPQAGSTKTYRLHGNFVPEAFSTDDSGLFMLEYLPPVEPTAYRVVRLTLDKGKVEELYGRTKGVEPPKRMAGTRLQQIPAPDGSELYTLYTNQSPVYAKEYATETHESGPVAFIHTLSLQDGWAYCLDLPKGFGPGPSSAKAIALSPDGTELYAVDTDRGLLAVLNTGSLKVVRSADVAFHLPDGGQTVASVSSDGKDLYVARGSQVETVSLASLTTAGGWTLNGTATGLASSEDGNRLYASTSNGLQVLDPSTGGSLRSLSLSGVSGIAYVGSTGS